MRRLIPSLFVLSALLLADATTAHAAVVAGSSTAPSRPKAPAMKLVDLEGKAVDWKRFEGKVVLVDFWATWCQPCRVSMPEMQKVHERWSKKGFSVVGISVDTQGPANVQRFVATRKLTYPIAIDDPDDSVAGRFGVYALPWAVLVDRKGQVVHQWVGAPPTEELEQRLATLLPD